MSVMFCHVFSCPLVFEFAFLQRLMGVNPRVIPKLDLRWELLPQPFVACRDLDILMQNCKVVQQLLQVEPQQRSWILTCDETCWHPTLDLIAGLRDELGYVGGYFHKADAEQDLSFLTLDKKKKNLSDSDFEQLARLSQHYAASQQVSYIIIHYDILLFGIFLNIISTYCNSFIYNYFHAGQIYQEFPAQYTHAISFLSKPISNLFMHMRNQVITRCDTNVHSYAVDFIPRPPKAAGIVGNGAENTFLEFGRCLLQATIANGGVPPIGVAYDASTAHVNINKAFLGLASRSDLEKAEFFSDCSVRGIKLKCFKFGCLLYKDGFGMIWIDLII